MSPYSRSEIAMHITNAENAEDDTIETTCIISISESLLAIAKMMMNERIKLR